MAPPYFHWDGFDYSTEVGSRPVMVWKDIPWFNSVIFDHGMLANDRPALPDAVHAPDTVLVRQTYTPSCANQLDVDLC